MTHIRRAAFLFMLGLAAAGCDGTPLPPDYGSETGGEIALVIDEFNEAKSDSAKFNKMFAGKAPATARKYDPFMYEIDGRPQVSGDTATADVKIINDGDGEERGVKVWTFVKEGDRWKIQDAPLP